MACKRLLGPLLLINIAILRDEFWLQVFLACLQFQQLVVWKKRFSNNHFWREALIVMTNILKWNLALLRTVCTYLREM